MMLTRRHLFLGALGAGAFPALPAAVEGGMPRIDRLKPVITPELRLHNANTDERMSTVFWRDGRFEEHELRRIDWFMRDWREAKARPVDRNLLWGLAAVREAAMRDGHHGELRFLSGFRSRKTNDLLRRMGRDAARDSLHIRARAVDFSVPGMPVELVSHYARWLEMGGVGHYPGRFVHIDTGEIRHWTG